jgi:hypothetical protein
MDIAFAGSIILITWTVVRHDIDEEFKLQCRSPCALLICAAVNFQLPDLLLCADGQF